MNFKSVALFVAVAIVSSLWFTNRLSLNGVAEVKDLAIAKVSELFPQDEKLVVMEPTSDIKAIVSPVKEAISRVKVSPSDKLALAKFYDHFSNIVINDGKLIQTTGQIRSAHITAGKLMFTGILLKDRYSDELEKAIDTAIAGGIGLENKAVDRARASAVFSGLAWAFNS